MQSHVRIIRLLSWIVLLPVALYFYFFRAELIQGGIQSAVSASVILGYSLYFFLGCIRGFTFIPATNLILIGIPFFRPMPLFLLSLAGILVSSICIYYFSESLHLDEVFKTKHEEKLKKMKGVLQRNQMPIIIVWSFFPLAPTDLICYVCGVLRVDVARVILGVLIGEGTICAIYIFLGDTVLRFLHLR